MEQSVRSDSTHVSAAQLEMRDPKQEAKVDALLAAPSVDPGPDGTLFAMEARHRSLRDAADEVWETYAGLSKSAPGFAEAEAAWNAAVGRANVAADEMAEVRATTLAGVQAKARCIRLSGLEDGAEGVVASVIADLIAMITPNPAPLTAAACDPIFAAIETAHALHAVERAAYAVCGELPDDAPEWGPHDAAYHVWLGHIDNVFLKTVPTTSAGCVALARFAVEFCREEGIALSHATEAGEVDNLAPLQLIAQSPAVAPPADLLAASIPACSIRRDAEAPTNRLCSEMPDLSALTIRQLSNLYDRHVQAADFWLDALHAPWANHPEGAGLREPNAAGALVEAEQDRAAALRDGVANELARREPPKDRWDSDFRLEAMIRHEILCNGSLRHAPELRAAITEQWGSAA